MRRVLYPAALATLVACRGSAPSPTVEADAAPPTTTTSSSLDASTADAATASATTTASEAAAALAPLDPFGVARTAARAGCGGLFEEQVSPTDVRTSFVDGDDLLALVNRSPTGQLPLDYAPRDLVDLRTGKPLDAAACDKVQCLRKDAAAALSELLARMKELGFPGKVESAFRSYGVQCGTFLNWARKSSFCEATEQSALPGHSQHQLGTTVDLFTEAWAKDERGVFREGFGCTVAGKFLQEHAWDFGFVMPYPLHPDDRHPKQRCTARWDIPVNINPKTGYRFEHWHIRYVGKENALAFKAAWEASGPGTPGELTVEGWLRAQKELGGADAELPVCDGCNCGACATLAAPGASVCDRKKGRALGGALHLDVHGRPLAAERPPKVLEAALAPSRSKRTANAAIVEVKVDVPEHTATQTPIAGPAGASYAEGDATYTSLSPYPETAPRAFPPIPGAWVVGVEPVPNDTGTPFPFRAALTSDAHAAIYNRANVVLPAKAGEITLRIPVPRDTKQVRVALVEGGKAGEVTVADFVVTAVRAEGSGSVTPAGRSRARP